MRPDRLTLLAFASFIVIGGTISVAIRLASFELAPLWAAGLRFGLGALILGGLAIAARAPFPRGVNLAGAVLSGLLFYGAYVPLFYFGLSNAPAAVASIIGAFETLATLLLAAAIGLERLTRRGLAGALIGVAGIAAIVSDQLGAAVPPLALAALGGATVCFAATLVTLKRLPLGNANAGLALGMAIGAPILFGLSALVRESWALPVRTETWVAFVFLVLGGTVLGYQLGYFVIRRWTASAFSYGGLLTPLVTLVVAAIVLGEPIRSTTLLGGALILGGTYVGTFIGQATPLPAPPPTELDPTLLVDTVATGEQPLG